jgi:hypothetical protein
MSGDVLIDVEGRELERGVSSAFALGNTAPDEPTLITDESGDTIDGQTGEVVSTKADETEPVVHDEDPHPEGNQGDDEELINSDVGEHRQAQEEEANRILTEMADCSNVVSLKKVWDGNQLEIAGLPEDLADAVNGGYDRSLKRFGTDRAKVAKVSKEAAEPAGAK